MIALSFALSAALLPLIAAQSSVDIPAIEAHFSQSHIVPDFLQSFAPSALLSLNFGGAGAVQPGQLFTKDQVSTAPTVTVTPGNSSTSVNGTFTLAMLDADVVGTDLSAGENRHWLVNGVTVSGGTVSTTTGTAITAYAGPGPAAGSGPHRYVVLLYTQPSTFTAPSAFAKPGLGVSKMDFNAYVKQSGLGPLVAGTYITVEEGTATISIPVTSAVVSSTLVAPAASASASASGSASGAAKPGSGSSGTGSASTPAHTSGGVSSVKLSGGVVALASVILGAVMFL